MWSRDELSHKGMPENALGILGGTSFSASALVGAFPYGGGRSRYRCDGVRELRRLGALGSGPVRRGASKKNTSRCGDERSCQIRKGKRMPQDPWRGVIFGIGARGSLSKRPLKIVVPIRWGTGSSAAPEREH